MQMCWKTLKYSSKLSLEGIRSAWMRMGVQYAVSRTDQWWLHTGSLFAILKAAMISIYESPCFLVELTINNHGDSYFEITIYSLQLQNMAVFRNANVAPL